MGRFTDKNSKQAGVGTNVSLPKDVPTKTAEGTHDGEELSGLHGQNDLFREVALVWILVCLIDDSPRRVRRALKSQAGAVLQAVKRFGFRVPILVRNKPGGQRYEVIDGHVRLAVARTLDVENIPCILVDDLPELEVRRLALSLNKLQETGAWDNNTLRLEINEIIEISGDLEIPGFELSEIDAIRFGGAEDDDVDPADDLSGMEHPEALPVTKPGDLWLLRDHRLLCGSSRNGTGLANVLGNQVADVVFTDPPYNLKINGHVRDASGGYAEFVEASGEMSSKAFIAFLIETIGSASACLKPGGAVFACMDWRHVWEMSEALAMLKLDLLNICVWVKTSPGMGSLYRSQHEFVFVAKKPGASHMNNVQLGKNGRNRTNVWQFAGATGGAWDADDAFDVHPTVKPIRLVMEAMLDVTVRGDLVLDPFLGSGTTLLAAERTNRLCTGVEIEPRYIDLAIRRWQEMTGDQAVLSETGQSFNSLASGDARDRVQTISENGEDF